MSANPTPGPLIVRVGANGDVGIIATSQVVEGADQIGGALVAECFSEIRRAGEGARAEALANATLFAAAHDLAKVLIDLVEGSPIGPLNRDVDGLAYLRLPGFAPRVAAAFAALDKAGMGRDRNLYAGSRTKGKAMN